MTHPAQHHVDATRKRQKAFIEGRARGGGVNRPGKAAGGASEDSDGQSNATPLEPRERLGVPLLSAPKKRGGSV